jgi:hypothetical protein
VTQESTTPAAVKRCCKELSLEAFLTYLCLGITKPWWWYSYTSLRRSIK